ncbi:NAD(P)-dependent oxidoreductase [Deinococcus cavernae]|uniref:NAD(P)-dependent oxidoreductase n=1 Tax=Deinococcus cavernae TaxID=2320857 RepID=A0A418V5D5_9DEIO|nr:NAD(P)-dependent oxidoreductase [Deinococcus cavernae]RJF71277.1 NAD(P)-dependent oxidoreductase [Deinococcus cavernae]
MRVLVTGATGFLGGTAARLWQSAEMDVVGVGRDPVQGAALQAAGVEWVQVNLLNRGSWEPLFDRVDAVFHAAALSSLWGRWPNFYRQNVQVSAAVAEACARRGLRLVHVSTPSVYNATGWTQNVGEDTPLGPTFDSLYAKSKYQAEVAVQRACPDACLIRPRGIYGVGDTSIVPRLVRALRTGHLPRLTRTEVFTELTHVRNVVRAAELALHSRVAGIFNVTDGVATPIWHTIDLLADTLNLTCPRRYLSPRLVEGAAGVLERVYALHPARPEPPITASSVRLLTRGMTLDLTRARERLGYQPVISPPEGLAEVLRSLA